MDLCRAFGLSSETLDVVSFVGAGGKSTAMFRLARELAACGERVVTTTTTRIAAEQILSAPTFVSVTDGRLPFNRIQTALDRHGHCLLIGRESAQRSVTGKKAGIEPQQVDDLAESASALALSAILVEADGSRMLPAKAPSAHEPALPPCTTLVVAVAGMDAIGLPIADPFVHRPQRMRALLGLADGTSERLTPLRVARLLHDRAGGRKALPAGARFLALLNKADTPPRLAAARLIAQELAQYGQTSLVGAVGPGSDRPVYERWGAGAAIVMAAGASRRMGRPKQLLTVDGEPMIVRAVNAAIQSSVAHVVVVTGAYATEVTTLLAQIYGSAAGSPHTPSPSDLTVGRCRLSIVHNADWEEGQSASIRAALAALPSSVESAIFLPVDQPFMPVSLLRRMQRAWRAGDDLAAALVDGQVRGSPALFGRPFWAELMALKGDIGGRNILQRHAHRVAAISCDGELLRDFDAIDSMP